uniref:C2 domain-containing protein n=1 Tax=Anas zonorhyncha TaxID=75864 RepID=A0A8B9UXV5_9AVES
HFGFGLGRHHLDPNGGTSPGYFGTPRDPQGTLRYLPGPLARRKPPPAPPGGRQVAGGQQAQVEDHGGRGDVGAGDDGGQNRGGGPEVGGGFGGGTEAGGRGDGDGGRVPLAGGRIWDAEAEGGSLQLRQHRDPVRALLDLGHHPSPSVPPLPAGREGLAPPLHPGHRRRLRRAPGRLRHPLHPVGPTGGPPARRHRHPHLPGHHGGDELPGSGRLLEGGNVRQRRPRPAPSHDRSLQESPGEQPRQRQLQRSLQRAAGGRGRRRGSRRRRLPRFPGLVAANVRSLHTLVPKSDKRHGALRAAIRHYISWRALRANCSQACAGGGHLVGPCQCSCPANAAVTAGCCSRHRGTARVTVLVQEGQGWRGDLFSATDAYVRVFLGGRRAQTAPVWNNNHPRWGARLELGVLDLVPGAQFKVEVWDRDNGWDDDHLGTCTQPVEAGGTREVVCFAGKGRLRFSYLAACGPGLGGSLCLDYVPQPPRNNGGLYRFSHWPPRPGDGPVTWPTQEEQEEEEEEEEEEEGGSLYGDFGEAPGGDEDDSWEDLGGVGDAGGSREASVEVESSPGLQNPHFGLKKASPGLQNPKFGLQEDLQEPSSGSGEGPPAPQLGPPAP